MNNSMPPGKKKNDYDFNNKSSTQENRQQQTEHRVQHTSSDNKSNTDTKKKLVMPSIEEILRLPLRSVQVGSETFQGYYDEEKLLLYLADESGRPNNKIAQLKKPLSPLRHENEDEDDEDDEISSNTAANQMLQKTRDAVDKKRQELSERVQDYGMTHSKGKGKKKKKKGRKGIIIVLLIFVLMSLAVLGYSFVQKSVSTVPISPPAEGEIMVIEIKKDVIPGDEITEDILQACNIDSQTYNQIAINGNDLYRWEQKDNILGMYATEYISKGHYITTNAVTKIFKNEENPWGIFNENLSYTDVPIHISDFDRTKLLIGSKVNLHFDINKKEDKDSETLPSIASGIKVTEEKNVTTTNSYTIENVTIANILTATDNDLFKIYSSLSSIPEGNQEHYLKTAAKYNKEYISTITPAKIRVIFDSEYIDDLKKAVSNGTEVTVELTEDIDVSTPEKKQFYDREIGLMENMSAILK